MTTLRDILRDFQLETLDLAEAGDTNQDDYNAHLDEYIEIIKERLIGK